MLYETRHTTTYKYSDSVDFCQNEVHLKPRDIVGMLERRQTLHRANLNVSPAPDISLSRTDYFGNEVTFFSIHETHRELKVTATSLVEVHPFEPPMPELTPPWEQVRDLVRVHSTPAHLEAFQFTLESSYVRIAPSFADYAKKSFPATRPLFAAVADLNQRIYTEFDYDQTATTIATPVDEVLTQRYGVCQDFAHVMLCCLRSMGIPARYVSGYLRNDGEFIGAAASHAWVSVYLPDFGWIDFDPTNNVVPSDGHITIAWGRDYSDVSPLRGVALGGGAHDLDVVVDVKPVSAPIEPAA